MSQAELKCKGCCLTFWAIKPRKYCSDACWRENQSRILSEPKILEDPPAAPPRKTKTCLTCAKSYIANNVAQLFCSVSCSRKRKQNPRRPSLEQVSMIWERTGSMGETAQTLGISYVTLRRMLRSAGVVLKKVPKVGKSGYISYKNSANHRKIYERRFGVKLEHKQQLHHVDGVKTHNEIENLYLVSGPREHRQVHQTLTDCAFALFREGKIKFDGDKGEYFIPELS